MLAPYKREVLFCLNWSPEKLKKLFDKHKFENEIDPDVSGTVFTINAGKPARTFHIVWIKNFCPEKNYDLTVLVHESLHLVRRLFADKGLYLTRDSEEAYAYMQEWIVMEVLKRTT